ncbi:MAG: M48 family metallopeptidase [Lachnospiraceae bacterium]|nr:M48 family metallopeptidase [Lachnospiraceae bacterium]
MSVDSSLYTHDADKAALDALKAIPGFTQVMKALMKFWNEKQFKLVNMSTNLKLGENQLKKYYDMLPPICEKLGIAVPELYMTLDVRPNAYTYGDTEPFIVVTSGLFETMPDDLIASVLAHECGHIACRHTLYRTMGSILLSGAAALISGLGSIALLPIQVAFSYWMRCSEFSADRAAIVCDGGADKVIRTCMHFAGYNKALGTDANVDAFLEQAAEYRDMIMGSAWNKTLEFMMFQHNDHPLNAVRAYEAREWANGERFSQILEYLNTPNAGGSVNWFKEKAYLKMALEHPAEIMIGHDAKYFAGKNYLDVFGDLRAMGYSNVNVVENPRQSFFDTGSDVPIFGRLGRDLDSAIFGNKKSGTVTRVTIGGRDDFGEHDWFRPEVEIVIYYAG